MNILIEGWRGINHSFALVNQFQISELIKSNEIYFNDAPFVSNKWDKNKNSGGLEKKLSEQIIYLHKFNQSHDVTYRISSFNFNNEFNSKF